MKIVPHILLLCLLLAACTTPKPNFAFMEKTVLDQNTGLLWAKNGNLPGRQFTMQGNDNAGIYLEQLNAGRFAGYADWRIPTRSELTRLIEYAGHAGIDPASMETWPYHKLRKFGFTGVADYYYWSSTIESPSEMWAVDMTSGKVESHAASKKFYLWPVRNNSSR